MPRKKLLGNQIVFSQRANVTSGYNQFLLNPDDPYEKWRFVTLTRGFAQITGITEKEARARTKMAPEVLDTFVVDRANHVLRFAQPDYKAVSSAARQMIDASIAKPQRVYKLTREGLTDMYSVGGERILLCRRAQENRWPPCGRGTANDAVG